MTESLSDNDTANNILGRLNAGDRDQILACGRPRDYAPSEHFFQQGEAHNGIHLIEFGRIRSYYTSPAGREITLGYWAAGDFVGAPQIFGGGHHMWSSIAIEPSRGIWLPGQELKALVYEMPDLAVSLIEGLEQKGKCYAALLQLVATRSMKKRLAHLLLTMADHSGKKVNGHLSLDRRFTHEELASMIGATRQWVSLTLERFEKEGIVARDDSLIVVLDEKRLLEKSL
ncbi:MAG: Crp/Fnr family transcriptional regulator [Rhodospirillaceae bacterium]|nr:Crp/Fnr family transcriptional regulator [Rhodospirillaceae bacterium]